MGINHIELATGEVLMDLREDTVTEESLLEGYTAHNAAGDKITGTKIFEKEVVIISGHYESDKGYYINIEDIEIIKEYKGDFLLYLGFEGVLIPFWEGSTFILQTPESMFIVEIDLETGLGTITNQPIGTSIDWSNITNKPSQISYFNNDAGYLTKIPDEYITETELNNKNFITQTDLNNKGYLDEIPDEYITETELNNKGYITNEELNQKGYLDKIPDEYITETELNNKEYITSQDLSSYAKIDDLSQVAKDGKYSSLDNIPTSFPPSTHDHKELYYTKQETDDTTEQIYDSINKKADADEIDDIRATAEGKCKSYVLDNKEQLTTQLTDGTIDATSLRRGDIFLLREVDWPDYWWEPIVEGVNLEKYTEKDIIIEGKGAFRILETAKINLDEYALIDDIPETLAELTDDSTHRLVTDTEKASWNAKSNFDGNYNSLNGKPTIPQAASHGYNGYIYTGNDGVAEMGKYIDFHNSADHAGDFSTRLTSTGNGNNLNLPSGGGTLTYGDKQYKIVVSNSIPTSTDTSIITFVI